MNKCVYIHLLNEKPVYVGSGSLKRPNSSQYRSEEHLSVFNEANFKVQILKTNLTEIEAKKLEQETIDSYKSLGYNLFNRANTTCQVLNLDRDYFLQHIEYSENSPTKLIWKQNIYSGRGNSRLMRSVGDTAGSLRNSRNYSTLNLEGKMYQIHRVVWVLHNGSIPDQMVIDHIDGNRSNNSIKNLRCVTHSSNAKNKKHRISNTGFQSISESKDTRCKSEAGTFIVSWTEGVYSSKTTGFRYGPKSNSRDKAFALALDFRNNLISRNVIEIKEGIL